MSEEMELEKWSGRMTEVMKRMTVRVEEIAAKCSRLGGAREAVMEQYNQELVSAEALLRELESAQLVDAELAGVLESAEIHTCEKLLAVLETGGEANDLVEKVKELMNVDEDEDDDLVVVRITRLKQQLEAMATVMKCEQSDCVSRCEQLVEENREMKEKLERKNRYADRVQNNAAVQRLLNKSDRSREATLEVNASVDPEPVRTSTPLNSRYPSVEGIFGEGDFATFETPRTSPVLVDHRVGTGHVKSALEKLLKAQALPPLDEFRGSDDGEFSRYMRVFQMKYSETVFPDEVRKDILVDKLKGDAKAIYDRLPESVRKGKLNDLVNKMNEEFKGDKKLKAVNAMNRVRGLRLQSGRLQNYCDELESLTRKAYPGLKDEELSFVRSEQLYQQVAHWKDSLKLAEILETCDNKDMYEKMKDTALRMERLQSLNRFNIGFGMRSRLGQGNEDEGRVSSGQSGKLVVDRKECFNCGEVGHRKAECKKPRFTHRPGTGYPTRVGQVHVKDSEKEVGPITRFIRSLSQRDSEEVSRRNDDTTKIGTVFLSSCKVSDRNSLEKGILCGLGDEKHGERMLMGSGTNPGDSRSFRRRRRKQVRDNYMKQFHDNYGCARDFYDFYPP